MNGFWRGFSGSFIEMDEWLLDRVFQPVADKAYVLIGATPWSLGCAFMVIASAMWVTGTVWDYLHRLAGAFGLCLWTFVSLHKAWYWIRHEFRADESDESGCRNLMRHIARFDRIWSLFLAFIGIGLVIGHIFIKSRVGVALFGGSLPVHLVGLYLFSCDTYPKQKSKLKVLLEKLVPEPEAVPEAA